MTARQWAILWIAVWMAGTVFVAVVATQNFYTIDRLLETSPNETFHRSVSELGAGNARDLLRYLSSELNRLYFQYWNIAQLAIGILTLWLVVKTPGTRKPKWAIVSMLGVVLIMTAWITPQMVSVGRAFDFVPRDPMPAGLRTFGLLHAAYTIMDLMVLVLGGLSMWWLAKGPEEE